jgi:hypothetical protein
MLASAAFAKGNSTGLDEWNSVTTNLITTDDDVILDIHSYSYNYEGQLEIHADLTLTVLTGHWSNFDFGFCLSRDETNWDCMKSRGNYDPSPGLGDIGTVLEDGYYTGWADRYFGNRVPLVETEERCQNKWLL